MPNCPLIKEAKLAVCKVEEFGGLTFVYLCSDPAPLLPRYDLLVRDDIDREVSADHKNERSFSES